MKKLLGLLALTTAGIAAVPAQAATTFIIDPNPANSYVNVVSNTASCILGSCALTASMVSPLSSFSLEVGESFTFDFADIYVSSGFGTGTATLDAQLAFLVPGGTAGTGGTGNYLRLGGIFTPGALAGSLIWDTPVQQLTAGDGSVYTVSFGNLTGAQFTGQARAPVTVTLNSAVPEPATWAMMILGFAVIGWSMRRQRSLKLAPAAA